MSDESLSSSQEPAEATGSGAVGVRPEHAAPVALSEMAALVGVPVEPGWSEIKVHGVSLDSRAVLPGDVYLALPGAKTHGARFVPAALAAGAVAVVTDAEGAGLVNETLLNETQVKDAPTKAPVLIVAQPRQAAGMLSRRIYPHEDLRAFAVTGTNGKTTVSYLVRALLQALGRSSGLIGTVETVIGSRAVPAVLTTPEAPAVHALFSAMAEAGEDSVVMEVSSHALTFHRVDGVEFDVAGFTNLSQDHLDLHGTMEEYLQTKALLFTPEHARRAVVTVDDAWGRRLLAMTEVPAVGLGTVPETPAGTDADVQWRVLEATPAGLGWRIRLQGPAGELVFRTDLPGGFNVSNAALAVTMIAESGVGLSDLQAALDRDPLMIEVPGRMQSISVEPRAVVDFAHNPDGLRQALDAVRPIRGGGGKLLVVFGATGERDVTKRPIMGAVAARGADVVIVTDDDPHDEDPEQIRVQVAAGAQQAAAALPHEVRVETVAPRAAAIDRAVELASAEDTILVAGRGHESWQEVSGVNVALDDRVELRRALLARGFTVLGTSGIES
ncbi:UDP-N-acetylmuramoyl-L-alanyl-D-glutamate--2,6-diaminopimelate ligase [Psychromicrobium xiongbiense]|uniref:UDP-N-acetylmuramoyl-L-alanyl-D-glutamate--2, 6-diaminopimelate ligase n=1 Tax=Psychromicrobium xiongbiense TaxID=3051184 RepID=UPI0025528542|nr:UDP-N-acetylmuramoyl-L-alanyl-D-glutamate--2,6-diaminopimelate ligase [Psychromicrobium sp. YIM S02556]